MENSITFSTSQKRVWSAILVTAVLLLIIGCAQSYFEFDVRYYNIAGVSIFLTGLAIMVKIETHDKARWLETILILGLVAFLTVMMLEVFEGSPIGDLDALRGWGLDLSEIRLYLNVLICAFVYIFLYVIIGRVNIAFVLGAVLFFAAGLGGYFVLQFRGDTVLFTDLMALKTAMSVASGYEYELSDRVIVAFLIAVAMVAWSCKAGSRIKEKYRNRKLRLAVSVSFCVCFSVFATSNFEGYYYSWDYLLNGHAYAFAVNAKLSSTKEPEGYQIDALEADIPEAAAPKKIKAYSWSEESAESTKKPNIIGIMNESFADLSSIGTFETNVDYMPFVRSLEENTIKGNTYVSVFGGGTCDSEYSFLTGNTTAFLADNARPYQLYVDGQTPSLVSTLNDQGYDSYAIHPGVPSAWNRDRVYPDLGFQDFTTVLNYAGAKMTRGALVSDEATYQTIIDKYEHKGENPIFVFDVTIQNHGGYTADASELEPVTLKGMEGNYPMTEQYLSLIRNSDAAFEQLVAYFADQEEPTIIVMFGDHQPSIEESFYEELTGKTKSELSLEELQARYATPFVIWANYDIEEKTVDKLGINYLSALLLDQTGLEKTRYDQYLSDLSKKVPVINTTGIIDAENNYYTLDQASPYSEEVKNYQQILYNSMFDVENRMNDVFYLEDEGQ